MDTFAIRSKVGHGASGCINQINTFISAVLLATANCKKVVFVDYFFTDFKIHDAKKLSEIIDFPQFEKLVAKHNLIFINTFNAIVNIKSIKYGTYSRFVDVKSIFEEKFGPNFVIPQGTRFNDVCGDPFPGREKNIYISGEIFDSTDNTSAYEFTVMLPEYTNRKISFLASDLHTVGYNSAFLTMGENYLNIVKNLRFNENYYSLVQQQLPERSKTFNVIHVRNEEDAIPFWSKINKMEVSEYESKLTQKYCDLVEKYFSIDDDILFLSSRTSCPVQNILENKGYKIVRTRKVFNRRELNAIVDLLAAELCTGTFIGSANPITATGSTFSSFIMHRLSDVKIYGVDLDNIDLPEIPFHH